VSTNSVFSPRSFPSSACAVAILSSASMNSAGRCSCTASLFRCTKIPGPVSKKRSISSRVLQQISCGTRILKLDVVGSPIRCLRVKEIRNGDEREADHSPDDPELPADVLDARERDLHDCIVHYPVCAHGQRCAFRPHLEGVDPAFVSNYNQHVEIGDLLRRVKPRYTKNSHAEAREENEEERYCDYSKLVLVTAIGRHAQSDCDDDPASRACGCGYHHDLYSISIHGTTTCSESLPCVARIFQSRNRPDRQTPGSPPIPQQLGCD
jgi:hypothetical protein